MIKKIALLLAVLAAAVAVSGRVEQPETAQFIQVGHTLYNPSQIASAEYCWGECVRVMTAQGARLDPICGDDAKALWAELRRARR